MVFQATCVFLFAAGCLGLSYLLVLEDAYVELVEVASAVWEPNFKGVLLE